MNVANLTVAPAQAMPASTPGQATVEQAQTFSGLFAAEMGNALQELPQLTELPLFAEEMPEEDSEALSDLLAMIQQLLAGHPQQVIQIEGEETDALPEQAVTTLQTLVAKYGETLPLLSSAAQNTQIDKETLISTFMNQGLSQSEAESFTDMLLALAKSASGQKTDGLSSLGQQAQQLLETLGVEIKKEEKPQLTAKQLLQQQARLTQSAFRLNPAAWTAEPSGQAAIQTVQGMQLNQALARYQAEVGLVHHSTKVNDVAPGANQLATSAVLFAEGQEEQPVTAPIMFQPNQAEGIADEQQTPVSRHVVNADQFATEMSDMFVKQMKMGSFRGFSEAKIILHPETLGQVDVKLTMQNGVLTAHFTAETKSGKELLDNQMAQLRSALVSQGIQVDRLEVSQPQQQQNASFAFQQQQREQARQQSNSQQQQQKNDGEQTEFSIEKLVEGTNTLEAALNRLRGMRNVEYTV